MTSNGARARTSNSCAMTRQKTPSTTTTGKPRVFGEVFICHFPFTSGALSKPRPALILFDLQQDVLICRITSVLRTGPLDIPLNDWMQAGLVKPSVARIDRIVTADKSVP